MFPTGQPRRVVDVLNTFPKDSQKPLESWCDSVLLSDVFLEPQGNISQDNVLQKQTEVVMLGMCAAPGGQNSAFGISDVRSNFSQSLY